MGFFYFFDFFELFIFYFWAFFISWIFFELSIFYFWIFFHFMKFFHFLDWLDFPKNPMGRFWAFSSDISKTSPWIFALGIFSWDGNFPLGNHTKSHHWWDPASSVKICNFTNLSVSGKFRTLFVLEGLGKPGILFFRKFL